MSIFLVFAYLPISIYFFVINVASQQWTAYSWDSIHNPEFWNIPVYLPAQGADTFDRWVAIIDAAFIFLFFGMGNDAINMYRTSLVSIGFGRWFPSLKEPRRRTMGGSSSTLGGSFLTRKAKRYFDRKMSQATSATTTTTTTYK